MEINEIPTKFDLLKDPVTRRLLTQFMGNLPNYLKQMEEAVESDSRSNLQHTAHQLKGTAASYGFPEISDLASSLEKSAKSQSTETLLVQLQKLGSVIEAAVSDELH